MMKLTPAQPNSIFTPSTPREARREYVQNSLRYSEVLEFMYLDFVNNYLTVEKWASDNDLPIELAYTLLDAMRKGEHTH